MTESKSYVICHGRSIVVAGKHLLAGTIIRVGVNSITEDHIKEWLIAGCIEDAVIDRSLRINEIQPPAKPPVDVIPPEAGIIPPTEIVPLEPQQPNRVPLPPIPDGQSYGKWPYELSSLASLSLVELNAMVLAIDPSVAPFTTAEEARAQLSADFKPME